MSVQTTPNNQTNHFETEIDELTVQPHAQNLVSLGLYTTETVPKGFLLYMAPAPLSNEEVQVEVFVQGQHNHKEFLLSVNNRSDIPTSFCVELV